MASPGIKCASRSKRPLCLHPRLLPRMCRQEGRVRDALRTLPIAVPRTWDAPGLPLLQALLKVAWKSINGRMNYNFMLLCKPGGHLGWSLFGGELERMGGMDRSSFDGCCPWWSAASAWLCEREPESAGPRWALVPKPTQNRGKSAAESPPAPGLSLSFKILNSASLLPPSNAC